jgi:hypothetical protein
MKEALNNIYTVIKVSIGSLLIILFFLTLTFKCQAQVIIQPTTAHYFLEADDERILLQEKDSIYKKQVDTLTAQIWTKNGIIAELRANELLYGAEFDILEQQIADQEVVMIDQDKNIRRRKIFEGIGVGLILVLLLL